MSDLLICTVCETACCGICQPDVMVDCVDDTAVHCADCGAECGPCKDEYVRERRAEVAEDIRLNGAV